MVTNITAASAAFLVPTQAEGKFDPEQLEKAATQKKGGFKSCENFTRQAETQMKLGISGKGESSS